MQRIDDHGGEGVAAFCRDFAASSIGVLLNDGCGASPVKSADVLLPAARPARKRKSFTVGEVEELLRGAVPVAYAISWRITAACGRLTAVVLQLHRTGRRPVATHPGGSARARAERLLRLS